MSKCLAFWVNLTPTRRSFALSVTHSLRKQSSVNFTCNSIEARGILVKSRCSKNTQWNWFKLMDQFSCCFTTNSKITCQIRSKCDTNHQLVNLLDVIDCWFSANVCSTPDRPSDVKWSVVFDLASIILESATVVQILTQLQLTLQLRCRLLHTRANKRMNTLLTCLSVSYLCGEEWELVHI